MKRNKKDISKRITVHCIASFLIFFGAVPTLAQTTTATTTSNVKQNAVQTKEIKGVVLDATTGEALPGVRVEAVDYPNFTTVTDTKGNFTLKVPEYVHFLYTSTEDYNGRQTVIKPDQKMTIRLYKDWFNNADPKQNKVQSVVGIKVNNSTSVDLDREISNNLSAYVRNISRSGMPGQGATNFINGITSLNSSAQPLFVIDGVIWDNQYDRKGLHDGFFNNVLNIIDPDDIDEINVLTNATARYGARGANGVIEIKTKRSKSMVTKIKVNAFGGVEVRPMRLPMLNAKQYRGYFSDLVATTPDAKYLVTSNSPVFDDNQNSVLYPLYHNNTDWSEGLSKKVAFTQGYKAVVEGGDDVAKYNLSLGYTDASSTMRNNDFSRLNIRFNTNVNMFRKVETEMDIAYSRVTYNLTDNGWAETYAKRNISSPNVLGLIQNPTLSKYTYFVVWDEANHTNKLIASDKVYAGKDYNSFFNPAYSIAKATGFPGLVNPYWLLSNGSGLNKNNQEQSQFSLNFAPKYKVNKYLSIFNRFNYMMNRVNEKYMLPFDGTPDRLVDGLGKINSRLASQFSKSSSVYEELNVNYKRNLEGHSIDATVGGRFTSFSYSTNYIGGYNNSNDKMPNIHSGLQYLSSGGTNDIWNNLAYYLDASYNYQNKYFARLITTAETSSRFGRKAKEGIDIFGAKWAIFPSVQLGWTMSAEPWFNVNNVNHLKFNLGYDASGNDNIIYDATSTYFKNGKFLDKATLLELGNIKNEKIQWETTHRLTAGVETQLFDNRLQLGIDFYHARTNNLLALRDPGFATGFDMVWGNDGALKNTGLYANVSGIVVNTKDWRLQLGASLGTNSNEITKLPTPISKDDKTNVINYYRLNDKGLKENEPYASIQGYTMSVYGDHNILVAVGKPAGVFYGYKTAGVFATDEQASTAGKYGYLRYPTGIENKFKEFKAGDMHFVDLNGDGFISSSDMTVIGNPNPDIQGNLFAALGWKNFTLNLNFKYSVGGDVYNYQRSQLEAGNNLFNQTKALERRWTGNGQQTDVPRVMAVANPDWINNERFSDRWIEDGSYLKLKALRLTYKVPLRNSALQGLSFWGEANNLFTLTRYLGTDPEVTAGNGIFYQNIDAGLLSAGRSFNLGVSINL